MMSLPVPPSLPWVRMRARLVLVPGLSLSYQERIFLTVGVKVIGNLLSACSSRSSNLERFHARQFLAFHPFEESATGGGYEGEAVGHARLVERGDGIAPASDRKQRTALGQGRRGFGKRDRGRVERRGLQRAQGPVPHHIPESLDAMGTRLHAGR